MQSLQLRPPTLSEGNTQVLINYAPVLIKLKAFFQKIDESSEHTFFSGMGRIGEEELGMLVEQLLLSYFTTVGEYPEKLLYSYVTENGFIDNEYESKNVDMLLAILEEIDAHTRRFIPMGLGMRIPQNLLVLDVSLRAKTKLLITISHDTVSSMKDLLKNY